MQGTDAMKYIVRKIDEDLIAWKRSEKHKPLLLRGARQVGKSSAVRHFSLQFEHFLEINFEMQPALCKIFEQDLDAHRICDELSAITGQPIEAGKTLLFLDEIQVCPTAISSLRFFYENYPELHVVAAGSLLEFALQDLPSYGVGRIHSLYMYPFSFNEFLTARGQDNLWEYLGKHPEAPLPATIHQKLIDQLLRFIVVGGMPEVVAAYVESGSMLTCQNVLDELITSLNDDFSKYKKRIPSARLREVFGAVVNQAGCKFVYSKAVQDVNLKQIKECLQLLQLAGLVYPVVHTAANGIPLQAEANSKFSKYLIFDIGIFQRILQLDLSELFLNGQMEQINKGALAELFVGLELLKAAPNTSVPSLHYWQRDKRNSQAEVDYVIQNQTAIIPIEVKAGQRGSMQSLHLFLEEKKSPYGIRTSLENRAQMEKIKIVPLYEIGRIVE